MVRMGPELRIASFVVISGGSTGRRFALGSDTNMVIGRGDSAEIRLDDPNISRKHARVFFFAGHWHVQDLDSTNGTYLRGHEVSMETLAEGDLVRLGSATTLRFGFGGKKSSGEPGPFFGGHEGGSTPAAAEARVWPSRARVRS